MLLELSKMVKEEALRNRMGNFEYFKTKYKNWFMNTRGNDERRLIKREIYKNELLTIYEKDSIWSHISKQLLK